MQVVILAAGRGTRLAQLTAETPKPLISVSGRPILDRILASLPEAITDIIVITQYREEQIHEFCKAHARAAQITCVSQGAMGGTYGALSSAKVLLSSPFLVINGDDVHSPTDLARLIERPRAFGVAKRRSSGYHVIEQDTAGNFNGMRPPTPDEESSGILIATGAYVLDNDFFALPPTQMRNGEYGIPHTLRSAKDTYPVPLVEMSDWVPINTPEDLKEAEKAIVTL